MKNKTSKGKFSNICLSICYLLLVTRLSSFSEDIKPGRHYVSVGDCKIFILVFT